MKISFAFPVWVLLVAIVLSISLTCIIFSCSKSIPEIPTKPIMSKVEYIEEQSDFFIIYFENGCKWKATKNFWQKDYYSCLKNSRDAKEDGLDIRLWIDKNNVLQHRAYK